MIWGFAWAASLAVTFYVGMMAGAMLVYRWHERQELERIGRQRVAEEGSGEPSEEEQESEQPTRGLPLAQDASPLCGPRLYTDIRAN
jgi:hypothetical protein